MAIGSISDISDSDNIKLCKILIDRTKQDCEFFILGSSFDLIKEAIINKDIGLLNMVIKGNPEVLRDFSSFIQFDLNCS